MNKYGNRKITTKDGTFDSLREFRRWQELKLLERSGEIYDLERQVPFVIVPKQLDQNGKLVFREVKYIADFAYKEKGKLVRTVEDAKGVRTEVYKLKKKLLYYRCGLLIKEI